MMALISGPAAADAKTFPGALCQPGNAESDIRRETGGLFNNGGVFQVWTCPIVRDNTAKNPDGILSAFVTAVDQNPVSGGNFGFVNEVFCTLNSMTKTGSPVENATASTSGSDPIPKQLNFANIDAEADGYYYLSCNIPAKVNGNKSGILMYKVEEK